MRRVLIVSIAILVVMFATTAVRAGEQQVSDRLLEILKERQIISESEYAELSDVGQVVVSFDNRFAVFDFREEDHGPTSITHHVGIRDQEFLFGIDKNSGAAGGAI